MQGGGPFFSANRKCLMGKTLYRVQCLGVSCRASRAEERVRPVAIEGVGVDLVELDRIRGALERHGERFLDRILTAGEREYCYRRRDPVPHVAARFAAKEAVVKALGTGFAHGIWIRDVGVASNAWGRPEIIWSDRGRALRDQLGAGEGHVTLTDEAGLMVAVAVLMRKESK